MKLIHVLSFVALAALPPCTALADTQQHARSLRTLDVEIVDTARGGSGGTTAAAHATHQALTVTDEAGWASVTTHGPAELSLRARANDDHRGNVTLDVDLHRSGEGGDIDVAGTLLFVAGRRLPLARIERPDGSLVELFVTAR